MARKAPRERVIPAGEFKAKCLALLDGVEDRSETLVITKHGRPVARVVPIREIDARDLRGSVVHEGDLVAPLGEAWDAET
jgi:prevent-host-death family protein